MNRREFLGTAALTAPGVRLLARESPPEAVFPGMIIREREPLNLEFPFSSLSTWQLPNERFYIRNHFAAPKIDPNSWRLRVEGAVSRPLELSLADLRQMPTVKKPLTLECAGNGRVYLTPKVRGVAWQFGAVGNAEWTGIALSDILDRAGLKLSAVEIVLEGADRGTVNDDPKSPGPIAFARSLPVAKAKSPEVVLAYQMNDQPLPHEHGAPLRAVVGGWYGMASVKWLTRVVAIEKPFGGFWQTFDYSLFRRENGLPVMAPITEMQVKAQIARPAVGDVVPVNSSHRVYGAAWTGEANVSRVDISIDGGSTWAPAKLIDREAPMAWRFWEFDWKTPDRPGRAVLMARATDSRGRTQPMERDADRRTYVVNHVVPVEVELR
jgi:DMSO/TMAO reductase YedYZ molybdopterin-dependent catalytic subunit